VTHTPAAPLTLTTHTYTATITDGLGSVTTLDLNLGATGTSYQFTVV